MNGHPNHDQATGLRQLVGDEGLRSIAVSSGRGGTGGTTVVINLGAALAEQGRHVLLLDEFSGPNSLANRLGLTVRFDLEDVLWRRAALSDTLLYGPFGLQILPLYAKPQSLAELEPSRQAQLVDEFQRLSHGIDTLLIDARAASSYNVPSLSLAAEHELIVVSNRADSLTDAYAVIKLLSQEYARREFWVLANRVDSLPEAKALFQRLKAVSRQFLTVKLRLMGYVPEDEQLHRATRLLQPVRQAFPQAEAGQAFEQLATVLQQWPSPQPGFGQAGGFIQRLLESSRLLSNP
jgi:flagellar biosynthesis protein FlhG